MAGRRTRAMGLPLPLEVPAEMFSNPRFNREFRNLQSEYIPSPVILDTHTTDEIYPTYGIRRQLSPSTSTEASLQHYMTYPQAMVTHPDDAVVHTTSILMGPGVTFDTNRPTTSRVVFLPTADRYTQPTRAHHTTSNPPSPRREWDEHVLPERPSSANDPQIRYASNPPLNTTASQKEAEIRYLRHSREELDSRLASLLNDTRIESEP
jgi:hypothetical protein